MPSLEEYAAQQAQNPQQAQEPQQAESSPLDAIAARNDAEKYHSLMDNLREIVSRDIHPRNILIFMVGAVFGETSAEAETIAEAIKKTKYPGGYDLAMANINNRRKQLREQQKALEGQLKLVAEAMTTAEAEEREIFKKQTAESVQNSAMVDLLTFFKGIDGRASLLQEMKALYQKHREKPAAMGLLYGSMTEIARRESAAGQLDLVQQQEFIDLKAQVLAAAEGRNP